MKGIIQKLLNKTGFQLKRYPDYDFARRIKIMNYCNVDTLFDIGAATGGYATNIKELGYRKKIISFEPLKNAYEILKKNASKYDNWLVNHYALGNEDTKCILNVAGNSDSSSILNMLPEHFNNDPSSKYTRQEEIEIKKLDTVFNSFCSKENVVMLKIDVQGFEKNVLDGAKETLPYVSVIQVEMSLVPLYENQMLFFEMIHYLDDKGFTLFSLENGFSNPRTGRLLQTDGIFVKKAFANTAPRG